VNKEWDLDNKKLYYTNTPHKKRIWQMAKWWNNKHTYHKISNVIMKLIIFFVVRIKKHKFRILDINHEHKPVIIIKSREIQLQK
jgi:hypothetical protein